MLGSLGSSFQYFLSVSPQERLGWGDFNRWILEDVEVGGFRPFEARRRLHLAAFSGVTQDPLTGGELVPSARSRR
jgi:hypothetical protein